MGSVGTHINQNWFKLKWFFPIEHDLSLHSVSNTHLLFYKPIIVISLATETNQQKKWKFIISFIIPAPQGLINRTSHPSICCLRFIMYRQNYNEVFTEMQSVNKNIVFTMYKQKGLETKHLCLLFYCHLWKVYIQDTF